MGARLGAWAGVGAGGDSDQKGRGGTGGTEPGRGGAVSACSGLAAGAVGAGTGPGAGGIAVAASGSVEAPVAGDGAAGIACARPQNGQ